MQAKVWAHMNNLRAEEWQYVGSATDGFRCPQGSALIALPGYLSNWRSREVLERLSGWFAILEWRGGSVREM